MNLIGEFLEIPPARRDSAMFEGLAALLFGLVGVEYIELLPGRGSLSVRVFRPPWCQPAGKWNAK